MLPGTWLGGCARLTPLLCRLLLLARLLTGLSPLLAGLLGLLARRLLLPRLLCRLLTLLRTSGLLRAAMLLRTAGLAPLLGGLLPRLTGLTGLRLRRGL